LPDINAHNNPRLCVVLPNYNHGHCIERALQALVDQDRPPDEIIVIDDASTDDSQGVIERFSRSSVPVRLLVNERNLGVAWSLQRGLLASQAHYVYFAAADDWVLPQFFSFAIKTLEGHPDVGFFCGDAVLLDAKTHAFYGYRPIVRPLYRAGRVGREQALELLRTADNWILTGSTVFRRDGLMTEGGFDIHLESFADGFLARKIALKHGFYYTPTVVATWCVSRDSVSRKTAVGLERARHILETVPKRIASDPAFPAWYADKFERRWRFATLRLAMEDNAPDPAFVALMGVRSAADRLVMQTVERLPGKRLRQLVALGWFWHRWRPYKLSDLLGTALTRGLQRCFGSTGRWRT
jgi:glycosyltransferase involved in cell wall biosynthesis